ncbi:MAG: ATPase [Rickettsiaceae bacterium]|jgi:two-component system osmolarity sensor histidine kinase EnvZ|nr:ATPase [Rickettsiaceae bacterium]
MAIALSNDINMITAAIKSEPPETREAMADLLNNSSDLKISLLRDKPISPTSKEVLNDFGTFTAAVDRRIQENHSVYYTNDKSDVVTEIELPDGVLRIISSDKRLRNPSSYIFILWMTGTALIFITISIFFMRNQVRSITTLATVADKFGKGQDTDNFKPAGATEVRQVANAFIDMRDRIRKQIEQRTEMLAGVSHDLKTPLTRMKLQLAMMKQTDEIKELQDDVTELEKMVQGFLDFAKGKERVTDNSVNISDLLRSVIAGYRHNHKNIELKAQKGAELHINSNAIRRVFTNIIDNALRYGERVMITVSISDKEVEIAIDDNGPGIPVNKRELVFKPFYRLDSSRHLESGNTGLGLSIAKDIVTGYGGDITLEDSPIGGLRVVIRLLV